MAHAFGKTLLSVAAAFVAATSLGAQDGTFKDAVTKLRLGQTEAAKELFAQVLRDDPSNAKALELYRATDEDVWEMLLTNDEEQVRKIAQLLMDRAKAQTVEQSRDAEAASALAATAVQGADFGERKAASLQLSREHGEFGVAALLKQMRMSDGETQKANALTAMIDVGRRAVWPLVAALDTADAMERASLVSVLATLRDPRSAPALAHLAESDEQEAVRQGARDALQVMGVNGAATDLYLSAADRLLEGRGVGGVPAAPVLWSYEGGELMAADVPAEVYSLALARDAAHEALEINPSSQAASSAVAKSNLAMASVIETTLAAEPEHAGLAEWSGRIAEFEMVALATGPETLRMALTESMRAGLSPIAVQTAKALGKTESAADLSSSPLIQALDSTDKRLAYAAALALTEASSGRSLPNADKVVAVLGDAVAQEALLRVQVVDSSPGTRAAVQEASVRRGTDVRIAETATSATGSILRSPDIDVVVINEVLEDAEPEVLIGILKENSATSDVKIIIAARDVETATERFDGKADAVIQGPIEADTLAAAIRDAGVEIPALRARADKVAVAAGEALVALGGRDIDLNGALGNLEAQLGRNDEVAVPAAHALGQSGSGEQLSALVSVVSGGSSDALRAAAARASGMIMGRAGQAMPEAVSSLMAVLRSDASPEVRSAIAAALGEARLAPGTRLELVDLLRNPKAAGGAAAEESMDEDAEG